MINLIDLVYPWLEEKYVEGHDIQWRLEDPKGTWHIWIYGRRSDRLPRLSISDIKAEMWVNEHEVRVGRRVHDICPMHVFQAADPEFFDKIESVINQLIEGPRERV